METLWFCLLAFLVTGYVVLDGYDLGVGALHLLLARDDSERRVSLATIAPLWDGNEVWLIAAGGTLYFAFPAAYASSFSGFYLPLMIVLWLLILRGISIEFRNHLASPVWCPLWDVVFSLSSTLLALFFGAALGNVVRGVPFRDDGSFFEPLWTDFRIGRETGVLDWYTIPVGLAAVAALALHGALWIAFKTEGELRDRACRAARTAWIATGLGAALVTALTPLAQPHVVERLAASPWGIAFPALAAAGFAAAGWYRRRGDDLRAFLGSAAFLAGMLLSAAFGAYPFVLPSVTDPALSLTVWNAAAPRYGLSIGLVWWIPGMLVALAYGVHAYGRFRGRIRPESVS